MKKRFLILITVMLATGMVLGGNAQTAKAIPRGELVYAVPGLGTEDFGLVQVLDNFLTDLVYEQPFRTSYRETEEPGIYPNLVERYEISDNWMTYDFYLHRGVQFHDGWGELTTKDVMFTFDATKNNPENMSSWYFTPEMGGWIASYEAVDRYHFRIKLSRPYPLVLDDMTFQLGIRSKKYVEKVGWEEANKHPIGSAPWKHVETVPGDYIKFEAAEGQHGRKTPDFKYLTLKLVPEVSSQISMLKRGEIDMVMISPEKISEVEAAGLRVVRVPDTRMLTIQFGGQLMPQRETYDPTCPWAPHTDEPEDSEWNQRALKVRKALALAINTPAIIDKIMYVEATPAAMCDFASNHPWTLPEWKPYPYNAQQAKALLKEAGYPRGFSKPIQVLIPAVSSQGCDTKRVMEAVANDLAAIGLKVERRVMDQILIDEEWRFAFDSAWKIRASLNFTLADPTWGWPWVRSSMAFMHGPGEHPVMDEFFQKAMMIMEKNERKSVLQAGSTWVHEHYLDKVLFTYPILFAVSPKIKGIDRTLYYETQSLFTQNYEDILRAD